MAQFEKLALADATVCPFVTAIAERAIEELGDDLASPEQETRGERYPITGADAFFAVAAYAVYRWVKYYFDGRSAKDHTELVTALMEQGCSPKEATAIVLALMDQISRRSSNDVVIQKALELFKEVK